MYLGYPVAGREWNDMGRKKEPQTNKTKKPRTSYTKRPSIWQERLDILSGDISVQQQMLFWVLNQSGTVQLQIVTNETNPGTWRSSRNRLLGTVPKFHLITFRISFQLMITSETDTSLPTPCTVTHRICQTLWTTWSSCMTQTSTLCISAG